MNGNFANQKQIREYLLGRLRDDSVLEQVEIRLMTDETFALELDDAEHELIEQFLDGELSRDDKKCFDEHFLLPKERREMLRLVEDLRDYASETPSETVGTEGSDSFAALFRWLRFATATVIVGAACFALWRIAIYESDTDKGLAYMRRAYEGQRLIEPRITALPEHAPYIVTRGADAKLSDAAARDRAERYLLDATLDTNDAPAHHALALLYFADKKYERTIAELDLALSASPRDPLILSDAGAIYLELAKLANDDKSVGKRYEYINEALKHLDLAISIDQRMAEPRFNRALCLEELSIPERAKKAWQEYLAIDAGSKWADEARRHLETLEKEQPKDTSAAELETHFIAAVNASDEEGAAQLIGANRELIRDKYLPQRLAASYVNSPEAGGDDLLKALQYAGEIEFKQTGDAFAKDIAFFYASRGRERRDLLSRAHAEIRDGYAKCLNQQFGEALDSFKAAGDKFDAAGDEWNAALANYFVGYALTNSDRSNESLKVLTEVQTYAQQNRYLWLDATVAYWIGGANQRLQRPTSARISYEYALDVSKKINDSYASQRNLIELARLSAFVGQKDAALTFLLRMFNELGRQDNSDRQRYRNYAIAVELLSRLKLHYVAKDLSFASIALADGLGDMMWMSGSRSNAASVMIEIGEYEKARALIDEARLSANAITDLATRRKFFARASAKAGELELKLGDHDRSVASYREAVSYYDSAEIPFYPEDAQKGLLSSMSALGQTDALEIQILATLGNIESYRSRIIDTQEQRSYFDIRAGIYEMACDFEVKRGNSQAAYDYSESGRARSLLDTLQADFRGFDRPLKLVEIRASLPSNVQLLQYAVLPNRLVIWVVTKDKFVQQTIEIDSALLNRETDEFLDSILKRKNAITIERGDSLYRKLILPVRAELDPAKELAIIPHKTLFALPFAALSEMNRSYLVEDFVITYAPSASVYVFCSKTAAEKKLGEERFLGVGNPTFDRDAFDGLPDLPSAAEEVHEAASGYKSKKIIMREKATTEAFLSAKVRADVIHFAGHYVVTPEDPMSSYMLFADDGGRPESCRLTNRDLAEHEMPGTKLIVLAACQTGAVTGYEGEGMAGLASMFLAAKVPLIVASNWSVDSVATKRLMSRFHELRSKNHLTTAQALRAVQVELLHEKADTSHEAFYWAGFGVFGGHARY